MFDEGERSEACEVAAGDGEMASLDGCGRVAILEDESRRTVGDAMLFVQQR